MDHFDYYYKQPQKEATLPPEMVPVTPVAWKLNLELFKWVVDFWIVCLKYIISAKKWFGMDHIDYYYKKRKNRPNYP